MAIAIKAIASQKIRSDSLKQPVLFEREKDDDWLGAKMCPKMRRRRALSESSSDNYQSPVEKRLSDPIFFENNILDDLKAINPQNPEIISVLSAIDQKNLIDTRQMIDPSCIQNGTTSTYSEEIQAAHEQPRATFYLSQDDETESNSENEYPPETNALKADNKNYTCQCNTVQRCQNNSASSDPKENYSKTLLTRQFSQTSQTQTSNKIMVTISTQTDLENLTEDRQIQNSGKPPSLKSNGSDDCRININSNALPESRVNIVGNYGTIQTYDSMDDIHNWPMSCDGEPCQRQDGTSSASSTTSSNEEQPLVRTQQPRDPGCCSKYCCVMFYSVIGLFLCPLFGVCATRYAVKSRNNERQGNLRKAVHNRSKATMLTTIGLIISAFIILGCVYLYLVIIRYSVAPDTP